MKEILFVDPAELAASAHQNQHLPICHSTSPRKHPMTISCAKTGGLAAGATSSRRELRAQCACLARKPGNGIGHLVGTVTIRMRSSRLLHRLATARHGQRKLVCLSRSERRIMPRVCMPCAGRRAVRDAPTCTDFIRNTRLQSPPTDRPARFPRTCAAAAMRFRAHPIPNTTCPPIACGLLRHYHGLASPIRLDAPPANCGIVHGYHKSCQSTDPLDHSCKSSVETCGNVTRGSNEKFSFSNNPCGPGRHKERS